MAFEFTDEQLKWLGNADKQDPYVLARMPGPKPPPSYFTNPKDQALAKQRFASVFVETAEIPEQPSVTPDLPATNNELTDDDSTDSTSTATIPVATEPVVATEEEYTPGMPGARTYNPLSRFSSYNYHITLYMITPMAYSNFVENGSINPSGMYIVAESGGTNADGKNQRLFNLDFYIDDLTFQTFLNTKDTGGPSVDSIDFNFKIYEPFGFNFLTYLKDAALKVARLSTLPGAEKATHHMQQLYMIGIKFYGYDQNGDLVTNDSLNKLIPNSKNGSNLQANPDSGIFTRYLPITIIDFQFKLDGKLTAYAIKAANVSVAKGNGVARNQIKNPQQVVGKNVEETLMNLEKVINKEQTDQLDKEEIKVANKFIIKFANPNSRSIKDATIITSAEAQRIKSNITGLKEINDVSQVNDKNASQAQPDNNTRSVSFAKGTAITQAIERIIAQSTFITNGLSRNLTEDEENADDNSKSGSGKKMKWFVISPIAKIIAYDTTVNDFAYEITYLINEYKIPFVRSAFVKNVEGYYGPHKRYQYWFTGKNTEVISYEQKYNGLYYMDTPVNPEPGKEMPNTGGYAAPYNTNTPSNADTSTMFEKGGEAIGSLRTNLYNPADQITSSITIIGDPDFIVTTVGVDYTAYESFYGADYSIDPHAGQVFIEIDFKQVIDYNNDTGVMAANDKLSAYNYPKSLKNVQGITYMAKDVVSTFSRGKFTQELHTVLWSPPTDDNSSTSNSESNRENQKNAETKNKDNAKGKLVGFSSEESTGGDSSVLASSDTSTGREFGNLPDNLESTNTPTTAGAKIMSVNYPYNQRPDDDNSSYA